MAGIENKKFSHSAVETFDGCPYKYKLKNIDKLETWFDQRPNNALVLGTALHESIETMDIDSALEKYFSNYNEVNEDVWLEAYKVRLVAENAIEKLPRGIYEYKLLTDDFIGFIDLLVPVGKGVYDIYDFKYSNNVSKYLKSPQVHLYKYYFEKITGETIRNIYYVFLPKNSDVWDRSEMTFEEFKKSIFEKLHDSKPRIEKVEYDKKYVGYYFSRRAKLINYLTLGLEFEPRVSWKCQWCQYKAYCVSGGTDTHEIKILPFEQLKLDLDGDDSNIS